MERTALAQAIYRASHLTGEYFVFDEILSREFVGAEAAR
jgi:hypothetical protein